MKIRFLIPLFLLQLASPAQAAECSDACGACDEVACSARAPECEWKNHTCVQPEMSEIEAYRIDQAYCSQFDSDATACNAALYTEDSVLGEIGEKRCAHASGYKSFCGPSTDITDICLDCDCGQEDCEVSVSCMYDDGKCRKATTMEELLLVDALCRSFSNQSTVCEFTDGCTWSFGDFCKGEDDPMALCDEDCSLCSHINFCDASSQGCTWDSSSCRKMTPWEKYILEISICQSYSQSRCNEEDICVWSIADQECSARGVPRICETMCGECGDSVTCWESPAVCGWSEETSRCQSCDDSCGACGSNIHACHQSSASCIFDASASSCRDMTASEQWSADDAMCRAIGTQTECFGTTEIRRTCFWSQIDGCIPRASEPESCSDSCAACENSSDCQSQGLCTWTGVACTDAPRNLR